MMEASSIKPLDSLIPEIRKMQSGGGIGKGGDSFGNVLKNAVSEVNNLQKQADGEIQKIMTGESQDLHTTAIAIQKADLSFQMMMQVRNKIVQAYQEVLRMPI